MKLDEAIEILYEQIRINKHVVIPGYAGAMKLGIEALKLVVQTRGHSISPVPKRLPGETPIIDTTRSEHTTKKILESPIGREPR